MARKRDVTKTYPAKQYAAKLQRLCAALAAGKPFRLQVAGERLVIPAGAEISVEHERSGDSEELEFQLRWKR